MRSFVALILLSCLTVGVALGQGAGGWGDSSESPAGEKGEGPPAGDVAPPEKPSKGPGDVKAETDSPAAAEPEAPPAEPRTAPEAVAPKVEVDGPAAESETVPQPESQTAPAAASQGQPKFEPVWLCRADMPEVAVLLKGLQSEIAVDRHRAARRLGLLRAEEAFDLLVQALRDSDADVREQVAMALGMIGKSDAVPPLHAMLSGEVADQARGAAIWALGRIGDARSVPLLQKMLAAPHVADQVREALLLSLSRLGGRAAITTILDVAATERNEMIRGLAMRLAGVVADQNACRILAGKRFDQLIGIRDPVVLADMARMCGNEVRWLGAAGRRTALTAMKHSDPAVRFAAVRVLDSLGEPADVELLVRHLSSDREDMEVRHAIGKTLGSIGGRRATSVLKQGLHLDNGFLRDGCIRGLAELNDVSTDAALATLLKSHQLQMQTRLVIANALGRIGSPVAKHALLDTMFENRNNPQLRKEATEALGVVGDESAQAKLATMRRIAMASKWGEMQHAAAAAAQRVTFGHVAQFEEMPAMKAFPGVWYRAHMGDDASDVLCTWSEYRWTDLLDGEKIVFGLRVAKTDTYNIEIAMTRCPESPVIRISLDGQPIGVEQDLYGEKREVIGPISFGEHKLTLGRHQLMVEVVRLGEQAVGVRRPIGLDYVRLTPVK